MLGLGFGFTSESTLRRSAAVVADVGGAALLVGEADGFGADFTYATDANRVAVKVSNAVTSYGLDAFFTNAGTSPKQVYDIAGSLVWSPHNMALQSQTFEQATPWNLTTALTVTANAVAAPDGTLTADRLVETATTTNHQALHANITIIVGATYTFSVYAKAGERTWLALALTNVAPADWFDLTNGVMGTTASGGTITAAGNGWYRCTITGVAAGSLGPVVFIRTANGQTGTYLGDITKGLYAWGAQLNRGSTPTAYIATTAAARFGLAVDYDPSTHAAKGLLGEAAATNLLLNNAALSTQSVTVTAVAHTLSFWGTGTVTLSGVSTAGPLVGTGASNRVSLTFTPTAGSLTCTVTGTVSRAQLEIGSVATSSIETFAATVTRAIDNYQCTTASINHNATAGSWWIEHVPNASGNLRTMTYTAGSGCSPIGINTASGYNSYDGSVVLTKGPAPTVGTTYKVATAFQSGDRAVTYSGLAVASDASTCANFLTPGVNVFFGGANGGSVNNYLRKAYYVPRRMTNTELVTKTT